MCISFKSQTLAAKLFPFPSALWSHDPFWLIMSSLLLFAADPFLPTLPLCSSGFEYPFFSIHMDVH